ncbi:hypothetical protein [Marinovum algicola]|uniref:hypothetical protein n=1 Tax=Marinovum algicola TaxID=42444 RepID=UPI003B51CD54
MFALTETCTKDIFGNRSMPTIGAWGAQPLSMAEIDAHPDADRIWATIMQAREEAYEANKDALEEVEKAAKEEGEADGATDLAEILETLRFDLSRDDDGHFALDHNFPGDAYSEALARVLDHITSILAMVAEDIDIETVKA